MYFQNSKNEINFSDCAYWFSNSDFCSFHNVVFTTWKIGKGFDCKFPEKCLVLRVEHAGKFWLIALLNWKGPCTISELGKALNSNSKLKLGKAVGAKPGAEFSLSCSFSFCQVRSANLLSHRTISMLSALKELVFKLLVLLIRTPLK